MDELTVLAEMRSEIPSTTYPAAQHALTAELAGTTTAPRRSRRKPILLSGVLAGAVAASALVTITVLNSGNDRHVPPGTHPATSSTIRLVAVTSPLALAGNATVVAQHRPVPAPTQWVYVKLSSTTSHAPPSGARVQDPGSHKIQENWTRVDMLYTATAKAGKTTVTSTNGGMGTPIGWPDKLNYGYFNRLPTDPDALLRLIRHNIATGPGGNGTSPDSQVFDSILALVENYPVLPAKLNAALYGVLARLKSVHLEQTTDNAGRRVPSLYLVSENMKTSIFVNPTTYAYAGQRRAMVSDRTSTGLDGTLHLRKGQILTDEAVLISKIVNTPGARS
jgi:hypothetical protein